MSRSQIQVTATDNELLLIASTHATRSTLLHDKAGYPKPVDMTLYPPTILAPGTCSLTMVGIDWGGPSNSNVLVTNENGVASFTGGGSYDVGEVWNEAITITI